MPEKTLSATPALDKLKGKRRAFPVEFMLDRNATKAATRSGFSAKTAYSAGARLLKNVDIQAAIAELEAGQVKRTLVDADWVITRLKEVAERCMERVPVMVFNKADKCLEQKTAENDKGEDVGVWEFDSAGANRALELLGKNLKMFGGEIEGKAKFGDKEATFKVTGL